MFVLSICLAFKQAVAEIPPFHSTYFAPAGSASEHTISQQSNMGLLVGRMPLGWLYVDLHVDHDLESSMLVHTQGHIENSGSSCISSSARPSIPGSSNSSSSSQHPTAAAAAVVSTKHPAPSTQHLAPSTTVCSDQMAVSTLVFITPVAKVSSDLMPSAWW